MDKMTIQGDQPNPLAAFGVNLARGFLEGKTAEMEMQIAEAAEARRARFLGGLQLEFYAKKQQLAIKLQRQEQFRQSQINQVQFTIKALQAKAERLNPEEQQEAWRQFLANVNPAIREEYGLTAIAEADPAGNPYTLNYKLGLATAGLGGMTVTAKSSELEMIFAQLDDARKQGIIPNDDMLQQLKLAATQDIASFKAPREERPERPQRTQMTPAEWQALIWKFMPDDVETPTPRDWQTASRRARKAAREMGLTPPGGFPPAKGADVPAGVVDYAEDMYAKPEPPGDPDAIVNEYLKEGGDIGDERAFMEWRRRKGY